MRRHDVGFKEVIPEMEMDYLAAYKYGSDLIRKLVTMK